MSLRFNLERHVKSPQTKMAPMSPSHLLRGDKEKLADELTGAAAAKRRSQFIGQHSNGRLTDRPSVETRALSVFLFGANNSNNNSNTQRQFQVKPFSFEWLISVDGQDEQSWIVEKTIDLKLLLTGTACESNENSEPISLIVSSPFSLLFSVYVICLHQANKLSSSTNSPLIYSISNVGLCSLEPANKPQATS